MLRNLCKDEMLIIKRNDLEKCYLNIIFIYRIAKRYGDKLWDYYIILGIIAYF